MAHPDPPAIAVPGAPAADAPAVGGVTVTLYEEPPAGAVDAFPAAPAPLDPLPAAEALPYYPSVAAPVPPALAPSGVVGSVGMLPAAEPGLYGGVPGATELAHELDRVRRKLTGFYARHCPNKMQFVERILRERGGVFGAAKVFAELKAKYTGGERYLFLYDTVEEFYRLHGLHHKADLVADVLDEWEGREIRLFRTLEKKHYTRFFSDRGLVPPVSGGAGADSVALVHRLQPHSSLAPTAAPFTGAVSATLEPAPMGAHPPAAASQQLLTASAESYLKAVYGAECPQMLPFVPMLLVVYAEHLGLLCSSVEAKFNVPLPSDLRAAVLAQATATAALPDTVAAAWHLPAPPPPPLPGALGGAAAGPFDVQASTAPPLVTGSALDLYRSVRENMRGEATAARCAGGEGELKAAELLALGELLQKQAPYVRGGELRGVQQGARDDPLREPDERGELIHAQMDLIRDFSTKLAEYKEEAAASKDAVLYLRSLHGRAGKVLQKVQEGLAAGPHVAVPDLGELCAVLSVDLEGAAPPQPQPLGEDPSRSPPHLSQGSSDSLPDSPRGRQP